MARSVYDHTLVRRLVALAVGLVWAACGRVNMDELRDGGAGSVEETCLTGNDEDADGIIDESPCSCAHASCEPAVFELAPGLEANVVRGTGDGTPATQLGAFGWWYRYHPATLFNVYGPLLADHMDPASYLLMEHAQDRLACCPYAGWYSTMGGFAVGLRSQVTLARWADGADVTAQADAVYLNVENSRQVVLEWRAPSRGVAELDLEVRTNAVDGSDMEWHVFVRRGSESRELQFAYLTHDGSPDQNGVVGTPSSADPAVLMARELLDADDAYFIYVRVGDDDAFDGAVARGGVRFFETR